MLERIRESSRSGLTMVIFAIICVVFAISFGAPMDGCQRSNGPERAATVNGHDVMTDEVGIIYYRYGGSNKSPTEAEVAQEKSKALKAVIMLHLMADEARKMGLRVSEDELLEYVRDPLRNAELPTILGGRLGIYRRYINNQLRVSQPQFQEFKKTELLARKLLTLAEMQVGVLPGEVEQLNELRNTKVDLEYIKITPAQIKDNVTVTDKEVADFTANHMKAIKDAYDERAEEFSEPAQVRIRRVYILNPGEEASEDERAKAQQKFEQAKKRVLEDNEDFGAVAKDLSEDFASEKEGLMDWTAVENMDQNIVEAIDGAEPGDIEEVVTDFAFMLVKLEERKEASTTPLAEVQDDIARDLLQQRKVDEVATRMATDLQTTLQDKKSESLQAALDALKAADAAPEEDGSADDAPAADGEDESDANPPSVWDALSVKTTGKFSLEGQDLSAMFGGQLPPGVSLGMGAWDRIPGIGKSPEVALDAFNLTEDNPTNGKIYDVNGAKVLIRLKKRLEPEEGADAATMRAKFYDELRSKRIQTLAKGAQSLFIVPQDDYGPYLENLYNEAVTNTDVTFNPDVPMASVLRDASPLATITDNAPAPEADAPAKGEAPRPSADDKDAPAKKEDDAAAK